MPDTTARYALPMLAPGQAQKELWHNEALTLLDMLVQPVVEAVGTNDTPPAPEPGRSWIVGAAPAGAWVGHANALATWTDNGWRFCAPRHGLRASVRTSGLDVVFDGTGWQLGELRGARLTVAGKQVVGSQGAPIAAPAGGTNVDAEARGAVAAILAALQAHGLIA